VVRLSQVPSTAPNPSARPESTALSPLVNTQRSLQQAGDVPKFCNTGRPSVVVDISDAKYPENQGVTDPRQKNQKDITRSSSGTWQGRVQ